MKRIYSLIILTVVFFCSAFAVLGAEVSSEKDKVTFTEKILFGEKAEAEGLKITNRNHLNYRLFWETDYRISEENHYKTKFDYTAKQKVKIHEHECEGVSVYNDINSEINLDTPIDKQNGISRAFREFYDSVGAYETKYKTVYLSDYYEYYPIAVSFDLPHTYWEDPYYTKKNAPYSTKYVSEKFSQFFKIPVKRDDKVIIEISKDGEGDGFSTGFDATNCFNFFTVSTVAKNRNRCFFSINNFSQTSDTNEKDYVDTSLIPGGYGIYAFYYNRGDSGDSTGIMADTLQNVYSLEKETSVFHLSTSYNKTELLIYTNEGGKSYLSVLDIDTLEQKQKLQIAEEGLYSVHEYDNFIVAESEKNITVLTSDKDGYTVEYTVPKANVIYEKCQDFRNVGDMDFNDGKLATVGKIIDVDDGFGFEKCGFFVSVYNKDGLCYYAEYSNALDVNTNGDHNKSCRPADIEANTIKWE